MSDAPDDAQLVRAAAAGDQEALSELVERHTPRVYGICLRYFRDPDDAEDATQETFVALLRRASSFEGRAQFSTWLYRVATNACNDLARKRSRRPQTVPIEDRHSSPDHTIEDLLAAREVSDDLHRALAQLDEAQRRAVVLHDVGGWPLAEIADSEGVAVGTVKSRVHRGHARLATLLGDLRALSADGAADTTEHLGSTSHPGSSGDPGQQATSKDRTIASAREPLPPERPPTT